MAYGPVEVTMVRSMSSRPMLNLAGVKAISPETLSMWA
jgi:hypothetical protein